MDVFLILWQAPINFITCPRFTAARPDGRSDRADWRRFHSVFIGTRRPRLARMWVVTGREFAPGRIDCRRTFGCLNQRQSRSCGGGRGVAIWGDISEGLRLRGE